MRSWARVVWFLLFSFWFQSRWDEFWRPLPCPFPALVGGGVGGCFDVGTLLDGCSDDVEDVGQTFDVELGFAVAFINAGAFAFADASVSCRTSAGTGVSAMAYT